MLRLELRFQFAQKLSDRVFVFVSSSGRPPLIRAPRSRLRRLPAPDYLLTLLSRGTMAACQAGEIGQMLVDAFEREAQRRVANGTFWRHAVAAHGIDAFLTFS